MEFALEDLSLRWLLGQAVSLTALALCLVAFSSKRDDRLLVILIFANVAFAVQFALFESWVASGISALIILRIILARRYAGHTAIMVAILLATLLIAALTWHGPADIPALAAGLLGTYGMFMLRGIAMRIMLAAAAFCWVISNLLAGSIGGSIAEGLIFITNVVTILRIRRDSQRQPAP